MKFPETALEEGQERTQEMTSTNTGPIRLTDGHGEFPNNHYQCQPNPGSVVLTEGEHGTAWQRFFSDGRWHPTRGGGSRTWDQLLTKRNLVLVYDAPVRDKGRVAE